MLQVLITLTPGRRKKFIDWVKAKVSIAVLPNRDVQTQSNSTLEWLKCAYQFREFMRERLQNPKYSDHWRLFTTQDKWTIIKNVMEVLRPFQYWTLRMSKRHTVTLHQVLVVYNDMFDHMDGVLWALATKRTKWKENLFFTVKLARQKLSKYYAEVTSTMGMELISSHILDPVRKLWLFRK